MNDSVIIYGGFEFMGFHLSKRLLEEGFNVTIVPSDISDEDMLENKRLELGRNANFLEWEKLIIPAKEDEVNLIILDCYSLHLRNDTKKVNEMYDQWLKHASYAAGKETEMIVLLPAQSALDQEYERNEKKKSFQVMENKLTIIFLPTIYGEWQPEEFAFQQACLEKLEKKKDIRISDREWQEDAIYVQCAVDAIMEIFHKRTSGEWLIRNKISDLWQHCAAMLSIRKEDIRKIDKQTEFPNHIKIQAIEAAEEKCEGLKKQQHHLQFNLIE
ncbi:hypothetical protein [Cytobacillus gottheilii]|uniref:hypothetical protein n=1 Tax=Cytobacillus gottheilii TaxID=859144 RepID=UPI0009BBA539|nr:hypothetical protein [Cytobacillus gottheilii]